MNGILCIVHFVPRIRRDEYPFSGCVEHKMVSATVGQLGSDGDGTGYGDEHLLCFVMRMLAAFYGLRCCVSPEDPFDDKGNLLFELRNGNMAFFNISFAVEFNQVGFWGGVWFYDGCGFCLAITQRGAKDREGTQRIFFAGLCEKTLRSFA